VTYKLVANGKYQVIFFTNDILLMFLRRIMKPTWSRNGLLWRL